MKNMMLQVKNFKVLALCSLFLVALWGCKDKDSVDLGNAEDPHWVITVDNDMTASMTAIVKVPFSGEPGTLAAFIGNDCCGIADYNAESGLYLLYISPSTAANDVRLKFYSPELKRIFVGKETFPFVYDGHLGSVSLPYTPTWEIAQDAEVK